MTNDEGSPNDQMAKQLLKRDRHHLDFVIRHSPAAPKPSQGGSLQSALIATDARLTELVKNIDVADRVALDTEADSLHSYREKLCLLQLSVPSAVILSNVDGPRGTGSNVALRDGKSGLAASGGCVAASTSLGMSVQSVCDFIVDPLSNLDFEPLRCALEPREIILHAADYDLRMLRRGLHFTASRIFDTVIAARLLGIREFSLGALVKRFFARCGNGGRQKRKWQIDRHFTSYRTASS